MNQSQIVDVYQSFVIIPFMKLIHKLLKCLNFSVLTLFIVAIFLPVDIVAQVNIDMGALSNTEGFSSSINLLIIMSLITLVPFFLISTTCFLRIIIVLSMLRQALATQQYLPEQQYLQARK